MSGESQSASAGKEEGLETSSDELAIDCSTIVLDDETASGREISPFCTVAADASFSTDLLSLYDRLNSFKKRDTGMHMHYSTYFIPLLYCFVSCLEYTVLT